MLTRAYVPDTISGSGSGGNGSDECSITKNGITVKVEPFDINEYFKSPYYAKSVEVAGKKFPLVINLYRGMSVFKITIKAPLISTYYYFDEHRYKRENEMAISYDKRIPIPGDNISDRLFDEKDKPACYLQAMDLLEKRAGKPAESGKETDMKMLILELIENVRNDPNTPLLNRNWPSSIGTGPYTHKKNESYEITGYIVFPEVKKRDAKLEFLIADNLFSFNVKSSLRYYKSAYDRSAGKYTPYVEITEADYNAIEHEEAIMVLKKKRREKQLGLSLGWPSSA
jgi:hypothetical protein